MSRSDFFIGWSAEIPRADRRFMLGAGVALIAAGAGLGATLASQRALIGDGVWDQGRMRTLSGVLASAPYPLLRTYDVGVGARTVFLATSGKLVAAPPRDLDARWVQASGTLITRGDNAMLALVSVEPAPGPEPEGLREVVAVEHGEAFLTGEILDAKCWFGAMRPGYGKTHKACAALCARGGLPLAFCTSGACGTSAAAPLLLDSQGRAHGRAVLPLVADPLAISGRLVQVGDVLQLRADLSSMRRL